MEKVFCLFITSKCNFACKTCIGGFKRGDNLDYKLFKKAIPQIKKLGFNIVAFTGGEPAFHPDFLKMVDYIVKNKMRFNIISNGSIIEQYRFIIENKLYKKYLYIFGISIDGYCKQTHDLIRQKGSFDKAIKAINYLVTHNCYTTINICLNKLNKNEIKRIIDLGIDLRVKSIIFGSAIENSQNKKIVLTDKEKEMCEKQIIALRKKPRNKVAFIANTLQGLDGINFCNALTSFTTLTLNPLGNLLFCSSVRFEKQLGNIKNQSLVQIYNEYLPMVKTLKSIRSQMIKEKQVLKNGFNTCEFCNFFLECYTSKT